MVNICLNNEEKNLLKSLIGKKLINYKHDPLDKFDGETIYGRIELFFEDLIILIDYDYVPYPLFNSQDDEHPAFLIKKISNDEAISALKNVSQITVKCNKVISGIKLIEDCVDIEWDNKKDISRFLKAIIITFDEDEIAIQGDYMMPLLDIIKGKNVIDKLLEPGDEFKDDPETKYTAERFIVEL